MNTFSNLSQNHLLMILQLIKNGTIVDIQNRDNSIVLIISYFDENNKNICSRAIEICNNGEFNSQGLTCLTNEEIDLLLSKF